MRCIAVIPARGGSKGLPRKNIRVLGGIPLVGRTVQAALSSKTVDAVYVSTDDAFIAETARRYGASIIQRPDSISGDTASSEEALTHALSHLMLNGIKPEILVFLQCTSPFTTAADIDKCVNALRHSGSSAVFSAVEDHSFLWTIRPDGSAVGMNHDETQPRQRRQDRPPQYRETGSIYVMRVSDFLRVGHRFCGPTRIVPLTAPPIEIDSEMDFQICEAILATRQERPNAALPPANLKALVMDFDGVLTDDRVLVFQDGTEAVFCHRGDGLGLEQLKRAGLKALILSKERNPVVTARAKKLGVDVLQGIDDKLSALDDWLTEQNLTRSEIGYIGNDVNDLACMQAVGWAVSPSDGHPLIRQTAHMITNSKGGYGAVREMIDAVLALPSQPFPKRE